MIHYIGVQAAAGALAAGLRCRAAAYDAARVLQFLLVVEDAASWPALEQVASLASCHLPGLPCSEGHVSPASRGMSQEWLTSSVISTEITLKHSLHYCPAGGTALTPDSTASLTSSPVTCHAIGNTAVSPRHADAPHLINCLFTMCHLLQAVEMLRTLSPLSPLEAVAAALAAVGRTSSLVVHRL